MTTIPRLQDTGAYALELSDIARHFGALVALSGINMRIAAGERRAVLGSNGAGKTTLFNAITGDFLPTKGSIRFFGEDITDLPPHERIRRGLRRTYQISQLFGGLTVLENIYLACRGVSRSEGRLKEALKLGFSRALAAASAAENAPLQVMGFRSLNDALARLFPPDQG